MLRLAVVCIIKIVVVIVVDGGVVVVGRGSRGNVFVAGGLGDLENKKDLAVDRSVSHTDTVSLFPVGSVSVYLFTNTSINVQK